VRKKFIVIVAVLVIGLIFLLSNIKESPPSTPQDFDKQQETIKSDVAGVQTEPSNTPVPTQILTSAPNTKQPSQKEQATLVKVVDGDTIAVSINGKNEIIRIIGIDTSEVVDPRKTVECFGKEASDFAKLTLQDNKNLLLESDPTQGERDKYKRLLRYVWIEDEKTDFGKLMIDHGFASEYTYNLPYKYQNEYKLAEKNTRETKKGLWADDACISVNTTEGDKDCSDFSVQDEAQTYFEGKGGSPTNNVDRLDSDSDGIACETLP
jgi:micrococcal nuclease